MFVFLVFIQVLILNNIQLSGFLNPYVYILFILLLPFETPAWLVLIASFVLGISVDLFSNGLFGLNAVATVFMGFLRPGVLSVIAPRDGYEPATKPTIHYYGFQWFLKYTILLTLAHHFIFFVLESFSLHDFFAALLRTVLSSILTSIFIILSQYFIFRR